MHVGYLARIEATLDFRKNKKKNYRKMVTILFNEPNEQQKICEISMYHIRSIQFHLTQWME